ncbi:hypothetical protein JL720_11744 [Aureococcus anophagefferens]|nr:hypothetical protein JL720_11744 [Aureococcus anophagefferens]
MVLMRSLASALAPQRRAARAVSTLGGSSSYSSGDGRRAAPRGAVWLGAAALGGAAYEAQESACAGGRVRVVTYNRVAALLDAEVAKGAVVCLQEVSRDWSGELRAYFADKGYQFSTGLYGTKFNGYMGVAVAWPSGKYDVLGVRVRGEEQVMVIHSVLAAERAAAGRPYVLCGDFNVKPYDAPTSRRPGPSRRSSSRRSRGLRGATGAEPDFTNFAYTKPMGGERDAFVETLDYIFCSAGQWKVAGVKSRASTASAPSLPDRGRAERPWRSPRTSSSCAP